MNRAALSRSLSHELRLAEQATSLRILLAEDNGPMRRLLALVLRQSGHEIVETRDGAELLEVLASALIAPEERPFDVVLCEHTLPGIPGLTVLAGLRARDRDMPFVLITGNADVADSARRLGAVILDHPFNVQAIRDAVRQSTAATPPAND